MTIPSTVPAKRYDSVTIALHWLIGVGIIVISATQILRSEIFPKGSAPREFLKALHEPAGMIVFALILVRIAWRLSHRAPALPADMKPWERTAASFTHFALYASMLAIPVLGLIAVLGRGKAINFGLFQIAAPFGDVLGRPLGGILKEGHEFLGQAILALAFFHAAAALYHHFFRKDDVLTRMMPRHSA